MTFQTLGLSKPLLDALAAKNYAQATPIQKQAIPTVLTGRDLLGIAQTGTGKTAAFMLPSLDRLAAARQIPKPGQVRMLVLAPTRELAAQIADSAASYGKFMRLSVGVIFGGVPNNKSVRAVARGLDVLVATPGRLLDLIDQRALSLRELEILVLDEADQMLDLGFIHALKRIVSLVPPKRQTLFFSAAMPRAIKELADKYLTNPAEVSVTPSSTTVERIDQSVTMVNQTEKAALLALYLQNSEVERALVFSRTKHGADKLCVHLEKFGLRTAAIHGNKSQGARTKALKDFKTGKVTILVATDIAARGLDIDQLPVVVNFDLPMVAEDYIHRIGRTGRAGAEGLAISLVSQDETGLLRDIRRMLKQEIAINPVSGFEPSQPLRLEGPGSNGRPTFGKPKTHARRPHAHAPSNSHAAAKKQHREWRGDRNARKA